MTFVIPIKLLYYYFIQDALIKQSFNLSLQMWPWPIDQKVLSRCDQFINKLS